MGAYFGTLMSSWSPPRGDDDEEEEEAIKFHLPDSMAPPSGTNFQIAKESPSQAVPNKLEAESTHFASN